MPQVADVRSAGGRSPLAELILDDGTTLRLHPRRLGDPGLRQGTQLTAEDVAAIERLALTDACEQRALRLLATRARSTAELDPADGRVGADRRGGGAGAGAS